MQHQHLSAARQRAPVRVHLLIRCCWCWLLKYHGRCCWWGACWRRWLRWHGPRGRRAARVPPWQGWAGSRLSGPTVQGPPNTTLGHRPGPPGQWCRRKIRRGLRCRPAALAQRTPRHHAIRFSCSHPNLRPWRQRHGKLFRFRPLAGSMWFADRHAHWLGRDSVTVNCQGIASNPETKASVATSPF